LLKVILRILAMFALAMALITAVLDITRSIADSSVVITSLGYDWLTRSPGSLEAARNLVETYVHPLLWDPVIQTVLKAPSWAVFAVLWLVLKALSGSRRTSWRDRFGSA